MTDTGESKSRIALMALLCSALVLRIIYFAQGADNPLLYSPVLDEAYYINLGKAIAGGYLLGENRIFFMDPLYGYALGLIFYLFGDNLTTIRLIQIIMDTLNVGLVYLVGAKVWSRSVGLIAGWLYALYKVSFFYTLLVLKTTCTITLVLLFTLAFINTVASERGRGWFFLGVFAACLTFFRANLLLMAPLGLAIFLFVERTVAKEMLRKGALMFIGFFMVLSIGAARNYWVSGDLVFISTQTGRLLYASNNPENLTGRYSAPSFSRKNAEEMEIDFHKEAERRLEKSLTPNEVSSYWTSQAIEYLSKNPGVIPILLFNKFKQTIGDFEIPNNHSFKFARRFSALARWPLPTFALALALGLPGLFIGLARKRSVAWLLAPILTTLATVLIFYTSSRFRMPAVPFLLVGAGIFCAVIADWVKHGQRWRAVGAILCSCLLFVISLAVSEPGSSGDEEYFLVKSSWNIGDLETAKRVSLESARMFPRQSRFLVLLGTIALSEKNLEQARQWNITALKLDPDSADAYHNLGLVYMAEGRYEKALAKMEKAYSLNPRPHNLYTMAMACDKAGMKRRAVLLYKEYLEKTQPSAPFREKALRRLDELGAGG